MISDLKLHNFRCFSSSNIKLSSGINFFYGNNGSGKTSILEAIYMCSSGKSFKSSNIAALVKQNAAGFKINSYDNLTGHVLDLKKDKEKLEKDAIDGKIYAIVQLAGYDWDKTKEVFGVNPKNSYDDNILLKKAWKAGWRPYDKNGNVEDSIMWLIKNGKKDVCKLFNLELFIKKLNDLYL